MSMIQQAAKRLEELRRAGVVIPWEADDAATMPASPASVLDVPPVALKVPPAPPVRSSGKLSEHVQFDLESLAQNGYLVPGHRLQQLGEEFRVIKRPLIRNAQGKGAVQHGNLIVVTSALEGEGKTFFSVNLALSLAMELDASALLVEADILRPAVLSRLGVAPRRGLIDLLADRNLDPAEVMLRTNVPKLNLLPAGSQSAQTTELLASARMGEFLDELATRYSDRIVIFDAPPLLLTSEARVLAARAGQVVVVAEAGRTPVSAFEQALSTLESCPVVMTVLNKTKESQRHMVYGYAGDSQYSASMFAADGPGMA